ncbi:MAG: VOC family protein, partial [Cyclobacteriaceae bacterium]|nr:VOC family protein [Cyclobacteriaceae bacterium]
FKTKNPDETKLWYRKHLGFNTDEYGTCFEWRQADDGKKKGFSQWSPFSESTEYFNPSSKEFMINYRVADLEWLVEKLKEEGVKVLDDIERFDYGKFVHILDHDGNKIELWEPVDEVFDEGVKGRTK